MKTCRSPCSDTRDKKLDKTKNRVINVYTGTYKVYAVYASMNKVTDLTISPNSFVSLHVQLHNQLRHLILSGRWANGSRLPSENEFVRHLKISRSTVRLALQQAEVEGLIERFAGCGTFVAHQNDANKRRMVAFITHRFDSDSLLVILKGAEEEARKRGYQIILNTVQSQQEEIEVLQRLKDEHVVGVLIWPHPNASKNDTQNGDKYASIGLPMVVMDRSIDGIECDFVTSDHYGGAEALMQHLVDLGHERIVFLTHQHTTLLSVRERYRAYCDVLQRNGLSPQEPFIIGEPDTELGTSDSLRILSSTKSHELECIRDYLLNTTSRPTAIFALHDYVAILAMRAMKLVDLSVPQAMSIAGFDDIDLTSYLEVPLTTVAQDHFTIGKQAASRLFDRLEGYTGSAVTDVIPTQLRVRASTSRPTVT